MRFRSEMTQLCFSRMEIFSSPCHEYCDLEANFEFEKLNNLNWLLNLDLKQY
jgi:hypothetical protein